MYPTKNSACTNIQLKMSFLSLNLNGMDCSAVAITNHDDVIKWKLFPRLWPFVWGIHRSPHKSQWCGALMFSLIRALNKRSGKQSWGWCHDVTVMMLCHGGQRCTEGLKGIISWKAWACSTSDICFNYNFRSIIKVDRNIPRLLLWFHLDYYICINVCT